MPLSAAERLIPMMPTQPQLCHLPPTFRATADLQTPPRASSPLQGRYDKPIDRESAYEVLMARKGGVPEGQAPVAPKEPGFLDQAGEFLGTSTGKALQSMARQAVNQMGRQLVRGLLGSLLGTSKRK